MYLANKFTKNALYGKVLLAKYISPTIALRYGTSRQRSSSFLSRGRNIFFSHLANELALECSMNVLYPYKIFSKLFQYKLIDEQIFHLTDAQFVNQGKILFF